MTRSEEDGFAVVVRVCSLLLNSSGEGVGMLERSVRRMSTAFGTTLDLLVLPDQVVVTEAQTAGPARVAVVKATPGLSRLDQVMDLHVLVTDVEAELSVGEAAQRLDAIEAARQRWPRWLRVVGDMLVHRRVRSERR